MSLEKINADSINVKGEKEKNPFFTQLIG